MFKTNFIALTLVLMSVFSSFLASPAIAAENDELAIITADRDNLRTRLYKAIAYSKARGKKLEETEIQLAKSIEERRELADRLRRAIAISKERGKNLESSNASRKKTEDRLRRAIAISKERGKNLASSNASRKQTEDRLRRAIAISKERGKNLASSNASRKQTEDRLRRAIAISKERGKNLASSNASRKKTEDRLRRAIAISKERGKNLASSNASRKKTEDRLRRAIAISKERGKNLASSNASRKKTEDRLRRAIAYSKSTRKNLEEQLLKSENSSAEWVAQTGASLRDSIGGLEGTEIIESYADSSVKIQLGNTGLFNPAGTSLSQSGKALLSKIVPQLTFQDASFTVVGHTDSIPVGEGSRFESNEALSFARSLSALQFLRNQGIPKNQLSASGFGADSPIASNETVEGRQQNRRVDIVVRSN